MGEAQGLGPEVGFRPEMLQAFGPDASRYVGSLDRVYAAQPAGPALTAARSAYRAAAERALAEALGPRITLDRLGAMLGTLAGRG